MHLKVIININHAAVKHKTNADDKNINEQNKQEQIVYNNEIKKEKEKKVNPLDLI